jgi:hypothetical protein
MRAALLSDGPSLHSYPSCGYDLVIGVNWSATRYAVDWWVGGEPEAFTGQVAIGRPSICSLSSTIGLIRDDDRYVGRRFRLWEEMEAHDAPSGWGTYSATAALVLAGGLGISSLDAYGCDMAGGSYWTGEVHDRLNANRWAEERGLWARLNGWLGKRSIKLNRMGCHDLVTLE